MSHLIGKYQRPKNDISRMALRALSAAIQYVPIGRSSDEGRLSSIVQVFGSDGIRVGVGRLCGGTRDVLLIRLGLGIGMVGSEVVHTSTRECVTEIFSR